MTIWVYYETDGDSGWHSIKLFRTYEQAESYYKLKHNAYGHVASMILED